MYVQSMSGERMGSLFIQSLYKLRCCHAVEFACFRCPFSFHFYFPLCCCCSCVVVVVVRNTRYRLTAHKRGKYIHNNLLYLPLLCSLVLVLMLVICYAMLHKHHPCSNYKEENPCGYFPLSHNIYIFYYSSTSCSSLFFLFNSNFASVWQYRQQEIFSLPRKTRTISSSLILRAQYSQRIFLFLSLSFDFFYTLNYSISRLTECIA